MQCSPRRRSASRRPIRREVTSGMMARPQSIHAGTSGNPPCPTIEPAATHGELRDAEDQKQNISRQFCSEHNQQRSPSNYRRDLKFKARFEAECERLTWQSLAGHKPPFVFLPDAECPSGLQMHLVPVSGHEEDIRRAAYAMVHSGLQGSQAQCAALKSQGYTTPQIAERLAITSRAVRLALSALQPRLEGAERIRWGSRFALL